MNISTESKHERDVISCQQSCFWNAKEVLC